MLGQALAGRKEYHDRTCADMVRGRFPAPWHDLNVSGMEDNILPRWRRSYGVYPGRYDNIDKWYDSDNHDKKLFKEI